MKRSVTGSRSTNIRKYADGDTPTSPGSMRVSVSARLVTFARAAMRPMTHTARNLPTMISTDRNGAQSSVCIVPRSFSPAVRSTAG